jgi:hypothetical protein
MSCSCELTLISRTPDVYVFTRVVRSESGMKVHKMPENIGMLKCVFSIAAGDTLLKSNI